MVSAALDQHFARCHQGLADVHQRPYLALDDDGVVENRDLEVETGRELFRRSRTLLRNVLPLTGRASLGLRAIFQEDRATLGVVARHDPADWLYHGWSPLTFSGREVITGRR